MEAAAAVPGSKADVMPRLGHFPMSEHYEQFAGFLRPLLRQIRDEAAVGP